MFQGRCGKKREPLGGEVGEFQVSKRKTLPVPLASSFSLIRMLPNLEIMQQYEKVVSHQSRRREQKKARDHSN